MESVPDRSDLVFIALRSDVFAAGGDGHGFTIGIEHLVHAFRRDTSFTYIVINSETYGLTKSRHSSTRAMGFPSFVEAPIDATALGLSVGATSFLARGDGGWVDQLVDLTEAALTHARIKQGFAFLVGDFAVCHLSGFLSPLGPRSLQRRRGSLV